jgi:hypothetical protein
MTGQQWASAVIALMHHSSINNMLMQTGDSSNNWGSIA